MKGLRGLRVLRGLRGQKGLWEKKTSGIGGPKPSSQNQAYALNLNPEGGRKGQSDYDEL